MVLTTYLIKPEKWIAEEQGNARDKSCEEFFVLGIVPDRTERSG
jgi:hypothetical protein